MLDPRHRIDDPLEDLLTPALAVYPEIVRANIEAVRRDLRGDLGRWRPHLKTAKVDGIVRLLFEAGIARAKCATTREAARALALFEEARPGASLDLLVAFPHRAANLRRIAALAREHPRARVSALIEDEAHLAELCAAAPDGEVGAFVDVNPGMDRTGVGLERGDDLLALARAAQAAGRLRGIHPYEGHIHQGPPDDRRRRAHAVDDRLCALLAAAPDLRVDEVVTSGTPTYVHAIAHEGLARGPFFHTVSPGTVIYSDGRTEEDLPELHLTPAALLLARVVSRPRPGRITCDAGHKRISTDAGDPIARCISHPGLAARPPSEEHLPLDVAADAREPRPGELLYLVPRHVCPAVNAADACLIVERNRVVAVEPVAARAHETGLFRPEGRSALGAATDRTPR
jgi:D-serine deaminase-like pyridoxal phosphate-dependent protein